VSIGILVLRVREPNLPRVFRTPAVGAVAPLGALSALYLMVSLSGRTWARLGIWFVIGMVVYFLYGVRHSRLAGVSGPTRPSAPPRAPFRRSDGHRPNAAAAALVQSSRLPQPDPKS